MNQHRFTDFHINKNVQCLPMTVMMNIVLLRLIHYVLALGTFVKQCLLKIPALPFNKTDYSVVQSDARQLKKLPLHLGLILCEKELSYADIARTIVWSSAMGITYISVYDSNGVIKRNEHCLASELQKQRGLQTDSEKNKSDIQINSGWKTQDKCSSRTNVYLLSQQDGRQSIVDVAKTICCRVKSKQMKAAELNPQSLDVIFQEESGYPDPDIIIRFGSVESLLGFMPWHVRLTEILSVPSHIGLEYKAFKSVLVNYGNTHQRFGK
ncbi:dehydrodolichyl diphosphate synthase complex subunit nus1-like [Mya arenaria]|uniref:dehydrodolichyl diphosphate synthase complex subunit nus1-like n=1 Tax=Mya arenaria TaxID=6604 RepID=UPI0022E6F4E2|nr:dehydrodolichyl diphosphate synthase complex subunit nus1-like [Mya arenaria]